MARSRGATAPAPQCPITLFLHLFQVTHMIDNEATVVFAMFMAVWGRCPCLGAQHTWLGEGAEGGKWDTNIASPFGGGFISPLLPEPSAPLPDTARDKPILVIPSNSPNIPYLKLVLPEASAQHSLPKVPSSFLAAAHKRPQPQEGGASSLLLHLPKSLHGLLFAVG